MAFERAYVNCKRCYAIAQELNCNADTHNSEFLADDRLYEARDKAMATLEEYIKCLGTLRAKIAKEAINACPKCDYSSPKIVEILEELDALDSSKFPS